ncbi:unnamed protein product [Diamesa hyperborea]
MIFITKTNALRSGIKLTTQLNNDLKVCGVQVGFLKSSGHFETSSRNFSVFNQNKNVSGFVSHVDTTLNTSLMTKRWVAMQRITKNIQLFTDKPRKIAVDPKTLKVEQDANGKPMVLIMAWLLSQPKHIKKFAQIYVDQGFDCLLVAADVLKFLASNDNYKDLVVHGFSIGGYMWGECLVHMNKDVAQYQNIIDRIRCQIWDSIAEVSEVPIGVSKAIFHDNPKLQQALKTYMLYHLKTFYEPATQHYIRSSQMFHSTMVRSPTLMFVSKTDPVGSESSNRQVADSLISMDVDVTWKCFEKSPHVGHYMIYKDEYTQILMNHLEKVKMIKCPSEIRANVEM